MKTATLLRTEMHPKHGTFGIMTINGQMEFTTLEPPDRGNEPNFSSIPTGQHLCRPYSSEKYKDVYEICDVHNRTAVLIHIGNWVKNTEGCVLIGLGIRRNENMITSSTKARLRLRDVIGNEEFKLTIKDCY